LSKVWRYFTPEDMAGKLPETQEASLFDLHQNGRKTALISPPAEDMMGGVIVQCNSRQKPL
jgi:hypothetical protein